MCREHGRTIEFEFCSNCASPYCTIACSSAFLLVSIFCLTSPSRRVYSTNGSRNQFRPFARLPSRRTPPFTALRHAVLTKLLRNNGVPNELTLGKGYSAGFSSCSRSSQGKKRRLMSKERAAVFEGLARR